MDTLNKCVNCTKWMQLTKSKSELGGFCLHGILYKDQFMTQVILLKDSEDTCTNFKKKG